MPSAYALSNCIGTPNAIADMIVSLCAASMPSTSNVGSASAKPRACASASTSANDAPRDAHLGQDEVRRAVDDAGDPLDAVRRQAFAQRLDDRDAAGDRGLEAHHHALGVRGREDLGAMVREQRLVRGDDVLAVGDRIEHQRARRLDAADELADDVDVGMADDDRSIVRQVHAGDAARAFARAVERARGDPVDRDRPPRASLDLLLVAPQDVPRALADGAEAEQTDVDRLQQELSRATKDCFDVIIDQSGFGNEVVRQTVADALCPLLAALDRAADIAPNRERHQRVVERLLDALMNEAHHGHSFTVDYSEFDETGCAHRKTFAFKLLKEVHGYSGEIALQLSSEAINLFLNALDLDIESEQIANEAVVQYQLERGKYDKARASAENARGQSLRYEEKIQRIIAQTKRDIRQVKWREEVHEILVEALEHIRQRLKTEEGIIRSASEKLDALDDANQKRESIVSVVRLIKECRYRHLNLNKLLMSARGEFLEQQSRQCFLDASVAEVVNLRDDVLGQLLGLRSDQVCALSNEAVHTLLGPRVPAVLSLSDLVRWQLQPKRTVNLGEVPAEETDLVETGCDVHRFDEDVMRDADKVFAELDSRVRLSELLARLNDDGCPVLVQDAVVLQVLDYFDPEDEREAHALQVDLAVTNALATQRCHGDDLWIEPLENAS